MTQLDGLSVLVAGATGGLGAPLCRLLAAAGARLTLTGRDGARLDALGLDALCVPRDLRRAGAAEKVVDQAVDRHGHLDGLVFAAGAVAFGPATEMPDQVIIDLFTLNTLAPIRLLRAALPHLQASAAGGGSPFVVHISAVVAETPMPGMAAYCASKAGLAAFDAAAARELRRSGIRLIDARPPHTETGLAGRPRFGTAPRLPTGLDPESVADRILAGIVNDETDLPSAAFS
ncbi:MAG: SDR family NAD(P)-dependent oxidoreductase [Candidatus Nanopelagicales bacterium]|jgi:cyclic-di-GMP-binding biofilm dispersal mediator protein|nr:SDR family NAD(P)-dependent oxidoreductase [Candidatus Nanopelagicales bacterium]